MNNNRFEIGAEYECRSACNQDCVWRYKVVRRTEQTIVLCEVSNCGTKIGKNFTRRVCKYLFDRDGIERLFPLGRFSMAPMLSAERRVW